MPTTRTFVAFAVPGAQSAELLGLQSRLAPEVPGVRWSMASPLHVTLAFLGDVDDTELNPVCKAVERAASGFPKFDLRLEALGAFPDPARARTVWAGLSGPGMPTLLALQAAIAEAVAEAGYPADGSAFRPHVTLGRLERGRGASLDLTPQVDRYRSWSARPFPVSEVVTYASTLTREGPVYAPLARAILGRGKPRPKT